MSITLPGLFGSRNRISPDSMRATRGRMLMIACATIDLPEPDSPTSATVRALGNAERHAVDRLHGAGVHLEVDAQVADLEDVGHYG